MEKKIFPVMFTFDVDGETLWLARDAANAKKPIQLSQGAYGPLEGVPRILKLLNKYDVKGTFFVPGMTAEKFPDCVRAIDDGGHEIGNHSWTHKHPNKYTEHDEEFNELYNTSNLLTKLTGKKIVGYRSPAWEFSEKSSYIMEELGFEWGSNMMHTNSIQMLKVFDHQTNIVDIPISWMLDDAAHWLYSITIPGKAMQPLGTVEDYWKREFDVLYNEFMDDTSGEKKNLIYCLTMHPQVIGTPARSTVLENMLKFVSEYPNVKFMTGNQVKEKYLEEN